jgi:hypothetical protein
MMSLLVERENLLPHGSQPHSGRSAATIFLVMPRFAAGNFLEKHRRQSAQVDGSAECLRGERDVSRPK